MTTRTKPEWLTKADMRWVRKTIEDAQCSVDCRHGDGMVVMPASLFSDLLLAARMLESPPL